MIEKSSQVGVTKIAQAWDTRPFWMCCIAFGWARRPVPAFLGARRPVAGSGALERHRKSHACLWLGLTATPIQLARAYAILANGAYDDRSRCCVRISIRCPRASGSLKPEVARDVLEVLDRVTEPGGTATLAQVPGFSVGGKTERCIRWVPGLPLMTSMSHCSSVSHP
ncbi:MAG: hypothetical protein CM15mP89_1080 [Gammaproteobacteria bacterium]|nr:MAG: hypothetical protein CM15mP89_1080 [Gammaproteobacteria bacterium]